MNHDGLLKWLLALLLLCVTVFGLLLLRALDRVAATNLLIADRLAGTAIGNTQSAEKIAIPPQSAARATGAAAANAAFFDPNAVFGGRLIQATAVDTRNMNHLINNDAYVAEFAGLVNSSLAGRNYEKLEEFQPLLAERWTISPDGKTFHIQLRKGVLYHDFDDPVTGKKHRNVEVTAHDFKFYVDVIRNPDVNAASLRPYYQDLDTIEILNDHEFIVRWKKPYYGAVASTLGLTPLPRHLYHAYPGPFDGKKFNDDHERNRILIGCGPYRFERWEKDKRVVFKRFEHYFGKSLGIMPPLENVAFEIYKLPNTRFQALIAEKLDYLSLTPDQWVKRLNIPEFKTGKLKKFQYPSNSYSYIGYNLRNPLFADKRVRQALTMLIDRKKILREVYYNLGQITTGTFFPGGPYYDKSLEPWPFDPARARRQLAEAGWRDIDGDGILEKDGRKFQFTILQAANSSTQQRMLPMIKEMLAAAGIDLLIQQVEWSVYVNRLETRNFEACNLSWQLGLDPDPYQLWHSSLAGENGSSNHVGFANPRADELIEKIRTTFNFEARVRYCHEFQRLQHDEQPYTFLFTPSALCAISGRYRNIRLFSLGIPTEILWTPRALQLRP